MSYDPTQQVPPQQGYPPQGYPQQPSASAGGALASGSLMQQLGRSGMVTAIAGLIVLIAFFLPWYSISASNGTNTGGGSFSGLNVASVGSILIVYWLVLLFGIAMLVFPILMALRKIGSGVVTPTLITGAIICLLIEILYLSFISSFSGDFAVGDVSGSAGPGFGFWLTLLATIVGFITYFFFRSSMKKAMAGQPMKAFAQPGQYPGQQPPYPRQ
jgi:hypothetical protein